MKKQYLYHGFHLFLVFISGKLKKKHFLGVIALLLTYVARGNYSIWYETFQDRI